ncbi:hypothetical protein GA0115249_107826 [Streptomyces sp. PpalLS-921]|nr:hypothetical protein GA0115249_107826 [Streptomyces sp. PpalLS-921]
MEWTDPRYADLVAAWEAARTPDSRDPEPWPARAFATELPPDASRE